MNSTEFQDYNIIITDTSCLILLEKIDAFDVLKRLFKNITTTPEIKNEFGAGLPEWISIKTIKDVALFEVLKENVDPGEASAITLAIETPNALVIIDDLKARKFAKRMALDIMGTLGMLLKAKQHGIIPNVRFYVDRIQETDFRVSPAIINYVLEQAGE